MTQFIHLTDAKNRQQILRNGIRTEQVWIEDLKGCYCVPVCRSHFKTHQWLRELKRRGIKTFIAVQFQLAKDEEVYVGRYGQPHLKTTASDALRIFEEHQDGLGLEVIVPRKIGKSEIRRAYRPSQVIGWRFFPEAKGKKPFCGCKWCNRGEMNAYRVITEE